MQHWHPNARETVAGLVAANLISGSLGQTTLAAYLPCNAGLEARIKRVQRFFSKGSIDTAEFWLTWIPMICQRYLSPGQRARVAIDWTKEGRGSVLCATLVLGGRGIPLMCRCYGYSPDTEKMAVLENDLARDVRKAIPASTRTVWLMDRGFGNARVIRLLQSLPNSDYVVRIRGNIRAECQTQSEFLKNWNPRARKNHLHENVCFGRKNQFTANLVLTRYNKGKHSEQWILVTNLSDQRDVRELYAARWSIEAQFRDLKSGLGFNSPRYDDCQRVERLMIIAAMAIEIAIEEGLKSDNAVRKPCDWEKGQRMVKRRSHVPLLSIFILGMAAACMLLLGPPGRALSKQVSVGVS